MRTPAPEDPERHCPRCGAGLASRQDWCLECGYAATTRLVRAPSWKLPVAIVLGVLALAGAGGALAVGALSDDANDAVSSQARTAAAAPTTAPDAATTATTGTSAATDTAPTTTAAPTDTTPTGTPQVPAAAPKARAIATWPPDTQGFTVVVLTASARAAANARARQLVGAGTKAGVLRSASYRSLPKGFWLVFSGRYPSQSAARAAQAKLAAAGTSGYVVPVKR